MSESSKTSAVSTPRNVRKGTRSCFECRYRKIRCIFRSTNPSTCVSCFSHGIRCASQRESEAALPSHAKMNISERVAQLEKELAAIREQSATNPLDSGLPTSAAKQANELPRSIITLRTSSLEVPIPNNSSPAGNLPILSLFDNAILASDPRSNASDAISREFYTGSLRPMPMGADSATHLRTSRLKRSGVCEALTDKLPSHTAMYEVLEAGSRWWDIVRRMHPYMCSEDTKLSIQSYVCWAFNQDNPAIIGCALSWIVLSLQCLPSDFDNSHLGLPMTVNDLSQHYLSNVNRLIVSDDELAVSLEGIECILLQAHFYGNIGRPRKAWAATRRGLSYATLLGLHRSSSQVPSTMSAHAKRRENAWWHLIDADAQLSLLLGLPNFILPASWDSRLHEYHEANGYYERKLPVLMNIISQRNQASSTSLASLLSATSQIDLDMEELAIHLPPLLSAHDLSTRNDLDFAALYEIVVKHGRHYSTKVYLHLPFMLQTPSDSQFDFNRTQCLKACCEMIELYTTMRRLADGIIHFCQMVDFQAFMATVILILALLGYGPKSTRQDTNEVVKYSNLICETVGVFRRVSAEPDKALAAQCLQVLEKLHSIVQGQFPRTDNSAKCKIFIPYFGMIHITPGSCYGALETRWAQRPGQCSAAPTEEIFAPREAGVQAQNTRVEIDIFNAPFLGTFAQSTDSTSYCTEPDKNPFNDTLAMDLDQDWTWMLNHDF
ncbi:uncharacterized protein LY89DRAFT_687940 [Mollisia scopiformis]|uniref:Zn(2)-C6 fungal-type domain-containing protein n=1 Tax=Mollisia scopiformis TaxID=149040 RepID=A0A194WYL6_MOLSC|nr:uncharacterized protein LY89DRAFT_687940 [Mollisia scopiformis]KUJ13056.1 hypothetical protein LY89DRAFT_687940 [Mollisia scopiformis]